MATKKVQVVPLVDIQSEAFAQQYEYGVWWAMYGEGQGKSSQPVGFLINGLQEDMKRGDFTAQDPAHLARPGFFVGAYHGGVLSPQAKSGITAEARAYWHDKTHGTHDEQAGDRPADLLTITPQYPQSSHTPQHQRSSPTTPAGYSTRRRRFLR